MGQKGRYYDGTGLLNKLDIDKKVPSIYIVTSNRSDGKTTFMLKKSVKLFREKKKLTVMLYRQNYELSAVKELYEGFMKQFPEYFHEITLKAVAKGLFYAFYADGELMGYSIGLYNPDAIKKFSYLFGDVDLIIMDEYQKEDGKYLRDEPSKLQSIYTTIARGGGEQARNIPCVLLGNIISIMNPYFIAFGIHKRLKKGCKKMAGHGWVAEFHFNEYASNEIKKTGMYRAFQDGKYMKSSVDGMFMIDSKIFIDKPKGKSKYLATIIYDGYKIGVREFWEEGLIYCSKKADKCCKYVATFKASDHNQNSVMLNHFSFLWKAIKDAFNNGILRFDDEKTKMAIYDILAVDMYK